MSKFVDYISSNIKTIASENFKSSDENSQFDLSDTLNDVSTFMSQMGVSEEIINNLSKSIENKFNDLIENGLSSEQAILKTFESVNDVLNKTISAESEINEIDDNSKTFNLDFANTSQSDNSILIDQAISKGMSVEEAIKYVNHQINNSNKSEFGPPSIAENKVNESENQDILNAKLENDLNIIEADMDDQNAKSFSDNNSINNDLQSDPTLENTSKDFDNDETT